MCDIFASHARVPPLSFSFCCHPRGAYRSRVWMKLGSQDCLHCSAAHTHTGLSRNYREKSEIKITEKTDGRSSSELRGGSY